MHRVTDSLEISFTRSREPRVPEIASEDSAPCIFPRGITAPAAIRCHVLAADPWCWAVLKRSKRAMSFSPGLGPCNQCMSIRTLRSVILSVLPVARITHMNTRMLCGLYRVLRLVNTGNRSLKIAFMKTTAAAMIRKTNTRSNDRVDLVGIFTLTALLCRRVEICVRGLPLISP